MKRNYEQNNHHIIPDSRGGVNYGDNMMRMNIRKHDSIHRMFGNKVFHEKVQLITELDESVLTQEIRSLLREIIMLPPDSMYKEECFRSREALKKVKLKGY